ncbi:MAG: efflux RND transporter periplasmic adaptor subunit [Ilyomonas sp.]
MRILFFSGIAFIASCNTVNLEADSESDVAETITPVTITHPTITNMKETVELNAISSYLLKTYVKANANGYLQTSNVHLGQSVTKGQTLFVIKTKEAEALGNTISNIDSSLDFSGIIKVKSPGNGYVTQLTYTAGNYVQDGEQLAEITDTKSFVFILNVPYELKQYLPLNQKIDLRLPDSTTISAHIQSSLPVVDSGSQTERYVLRVNTNKMIPENLVAKANFIKKVQADATTLPKPAVLSNEEQTAFWIMQLINDSTAVKLPIQKGLEQDDKVQILSPVLPDSANILLTGNYGLEDTARVKVVSP